MYETLDPDFYFEHVLDVLGPASRGSPAMLPAARWQAWWRDQRSDVEPLRTAATQGFVVSTAELALLGVSRSTARHAVRRGRWCVPVRGCIAPVTVADSSTNRFVVARRRHALIAAASVLDRGGRAVSGRSAAILHGLPTLALPPSAELTAPEPVRLGRRTGRHVFGAGLPDPAVESWFGTAVTSVARTLVDLGRHDRRDAIMAADAALREHLVTKVQLDHHLADAVGWPGVRQARAVLALASPLAESALESLVRLAMHDSGVPAPRSQVEIGPFRVDFCWPDRRVVLEADGMSKYSDGEWRKEKRREQALRRLGFRVERVTWDELLNHWPATLARLLHTLGSR